MTLKCTHLNLINKKNDTNLNTEIEILKYLNDKITFYNRYGDYICRIFSFVAVLGIIRHLFVFSSNQGIYSFYPKHIKTKKMQNTI